MAKNYLDVQADKLLELNAVTERQAAYPILTESQIRKRSECEHAVEPAILDEAGTTRRFRKSLEAI